MRQATKLLAVAGVVVLGFASAPVHAAVARGSIRGLIVDPGGAPLVGAAVLVLGEVDASKAEKVIRRASTDHEGKFVAVGIAPGRYRLKAQADGFSPVEVAADVRPNKVTVFDSILLRRVGTLEEETSLNLDSRYAARGARGTIFHLDDSKKTADPSQTIVLGDRAPQLKAAVQSFAQATSGNPAERSAFVGSNFAISEQFGRDTNITLSGQVGEGQGAPQQFNVLTTAQANDRHRVAVALGYGRFTFSRQSSVPRLGQFSVSATDTWQVAGPVLIVYGLEFARFAEGASGTSMLPRFGVTVDAGPRTRLFAGLVPGSSSDVQSRINLESGEIEFTEPRPVAVEGNTAGGEPVLDRSYRLQFGGEQILSDRSSLEVMGFLDTVSGHGVGLLEIPADGSSAEAIVRNASQSGRATGVRVVYHRRLSKAVEGSVGYAIGTGQRLDSRGITDPASLFSNHAFQVLAAKVDANFVRSGTRISTVMRLAPEQAMLAIDPFQGQMVTYDPNISVSVSQDLPSLSFIPGQWAAVIDLRNLFDQQASVSDDRQELIASRFHRLVRVGVSLRF